MVAGFVMTSSIVLPEPANEGKERALPPPRLVPRAQIRVKVASLRSLTDEHPEPEVSSHLVEKTVDQARVLFPRELLDPQLIEGAGLDDAARGQPSAGQGVADSQSE